MPNDNEAPTNAIPVHYLKSNQFRVIHADGAYGGITGQGWIHMAIYSERNPLPRQTEHPIIAGSTLGPERVVEQREGFIREIENSVLMNIEVAKALHRWLGQKIEEHSKLDENRNG